MGSILKLKEDQTSLHQGTGMTIDHMLVKKAVYYSYFSFIFMSVRVFHWELCD